jgi:hypothetical protein
MNGTYQMFRSPQPKVPGQSSEMLEMTTNTGSKMQYQQYSLDNMDPLHQDVVVKMPNYIDRS